MLSKEQIDQLSSLANYAISIKGGQTAQAFSEAATAETILGLIEMLRAAQKDVERLEWLFDHADEALSIIGTYHDDERPWIRQTIDAAAQRDRDGSQHAGGCE